MKKISLLSSIAATTLLFSTQAWAHSNGWYMGAGLGLARSSAAPSDVTGLPKVNTSDLGWKTYMGYQINRFFGSEFSFLDFGDAHYRGAGDVTTRAVTLNGVAMLPFGKTHFALGARLGGYYSFVSRDNSIHFSGHRPTNQFGIDYGLTAQYSFTKHIALRADYDQLVNTGDRLKYNSRLVGASLLYAFG